MKIKDLKKGDIVYYRNKQNNNVNHPKRYKAWFTSELKNKADKGLDIMKIKRYVRFLCFYRLKTIYKRYE